MPGLWWPALAMNTSVRRAGSPAFAKCRASASITDRPSALSPAPSNQASACASRMTSPRRCGPERPRPRSRRRQVRSRLGLERQLRADTRGHAGGARPRSAPTRGSSPSRPPMLKQGPPQFEKSRPSSLPGSRSSVNTATAPRLTELLRLRRHRTALEHHVPLRDDELHGNLAFDVDVIDARPDRRCRRTRAARSACRREFQTARPACADSSTTSASRAERRVAERSSLPTTAADQNRRLRSCCHRLQRRRRCRPSELLRGPVDRLRARRETR